MHLGSSINFHTTIYLHDQEDLSKFDFASGYYLGPGTKYTRHQELEFELDDKTHFTRLPEPYPSNCSHGNYDDNLMPGYYTENKCLHTCLVRSLIRECGAVPDQYLYYKPSIQAYLPESTDFSDSEMRICLWRVLYYSHKYFLELTRDCGCRVSCKGMSFKATHLINTYSQGGYTYPQGEESVRFKFASNIVTNVTEIPTYPSTKFLPDIGGLLGLFSGMSVLSIIELIVFFALSIAAAFHRVKRLIIVQHFQRNQDISPP